MDDFIDFFMLTLGVLFLLFMVVCIVVATATGHYEPIAALGVVLAIGAVVSLIAAVAQWASGRWRDELGC